MEMMARARFPHLPLVIVRPFNYTGPGQEPQFVIPKLVDHFRRRAPRVTLGNLHVQREYNDVRFVCEAYLRLLQAPVPEPVYNVCTGVTHDFNAVIGMLQDLTGHRIEVDVDPALVRPNEVHRLCGDPTRLYATAGTLPACRLEDTLRWMLGQPQ
jgi:nucleoside-diphosphate-sugar epimerase